MPEIPHIKVSHHHGSTGDWMPDYAAVVTRTVPSTGGLWSKFFLLPTGSQALSPNDVILIPEGTEVLYDVVSHLTFKALAVQGKLVFSPSRTTQIKVGTIQVYPTGHLEIVSSRTSQTRILFTGPLDTEADPEEFSLGLFSNGGKIRIEGRAKNPYTRCLLAKAGSYVVAVEDATGWRQGDLAFFADSQTKVDPAFWKYILNQEHLSQEFERRYVVGIDLSSTPHTLRLDKPLQFTHTNWVANETRSILIKTNDTNAQRAHVLFGGHGDVRIRNACLYDLGRTTTRLLKSTYRNATGVVVPAHVEERYSPTVIETPHNQIGRYPLHAHHLHEPVYFEGNVITGKEAIHPQRGRHIQGSPKWGIALHGSHGSIRGNVVIGAEGVGIVTEAGNETGIIEGNLVIGTGGGEANDSLAVESAYEVVPALGLRLPQGGAAWGKSSQGVGYWFRGPYLRVVGNKAAGYFHSCCIEIWVHDKPITIPTVSRVDKDGLPVFGLPDDGLAGVTTTTSAGTIVFEDNHCDAISPEELGISYTRGRPIILRFQAKHRGDGVGVFLGWGEKVTFRDCIVRGEGKGRAIRANEENSPYVIEGGIWEGFSS